MKFIKGKFLLVALILWSCGGDNNEPSTQDNGKDRKEILTNWADQIVIPSYAEFKVKFDAMAGQASTFQSSPNVDNLAELRMKWVDAYKAWQKVELFEFGPADKYTLRNFFNIYPADVAGIEANISDPSSNLEVPASYARQGFPALDYLINGVGQSDDAIVAYYTDGSLGAKRAGYVGRVVEHMSSLITNVVNEWGSGYRETFVSKTGLDVGSSFGLVANAFVLNYERYIRSGKIGIPSGAAVVGSTTPHADKVEAYYKNDISRELAQLAHQASYDFFIGKKTGLLETGPSFKTYLDALDASDASTGTPLSTLIEAEFQNINARFPGMMPSLDQQVQTNNAAMIEMFANMQKLVRMLKVDMTSAMSVTITYTDNDGD